MNSQKNVEIYNYALSDTDNEKIIFNESEKDWESSLNHKNFKLKSQIEIDTVKIDTITHKISSLDKYKLIIKLDVEGNEFKALSGAKKTIEKYSPIIIIEFSKFIFDKKNSKIFLNKFLKKYNYKIFNTNFHKIEESEIYELLDKLDHKYNTIGNYFLVKENTNDYKYFLNE